MIAGRCRGLTPLDARATGVSMSSKMASDGANFWVPFGGAPAGLGRFQALPPSYAGSSSVPSLMPSKRKVEK
jgi:hypothetical protein